MRQAWLFVSLGAANNIWKTQCNLKIWLHLNKRIDSNTCLYIDWVPGCTSVLFSFSEIWRNYCHLLHHLKLWSTAAAKLFSNTDQGLSWLVWPYKNAIRNCKLHFIFSVNTNKFIKLSKQVLWYLLKQHQEHVNLKLEVIRLSWTVTLINFVFLNE